MAPLRKEDGDSGAGFQKGAEKREVRRSPSEQKTLGGRGESF